jgi:hypothetical protein
MATRGMRRRVSAVRPLGFDYAAMRTWRRQTIGRIMARIGSRQRHLGNRLRARYLVIMTPDLDHELDRLQQCLPDRAARMLCRVRRPDAVWIRVPTAGALMVGGVFGFLPVLGFWMAPLGLALVAVDVPPLRRPLARVLAAVNRGRAPRD